MRKLMRKLMKPEPGTYALIFRCSSQPSIQIGRLGRLTLRKGYYLYVGSAFGPGGVLARVKRHYDISKPRHWQIDYLRPAVELVEVWYSHDPQHREHEWARLLLEDRRMTAPLRGFGASDCHCQSHLFYSGIRPLVEAFGEALSKSIPDHDELMRMDEKTLADSFSGE